MGAINWHTSENSSDVNLESSLFRCPDKELQYSSYEYVSYNRTDEYYSNDNSSSYPLNGNATTIEELNRITGNKNHTDRTERDHYPHLDEALGWSVDDEYESENCVVNLWDTHFNEEQVTTRIYKDVIFAGYDRNYAGKERRVLLEENIVMKNYGYNYDIKAFESYTENEIPYFTFSGDVRNSSGTNITLSSPMASLDFAMNENWERYGVIERYKVKMEWGYEKIFDGWFYDYLGVSKKMDDVANKIMPSYLKRYFDMSKAKEWQAYIYTIGQLLDT